MQKPKKKRQRAISTSDPAYADIRLRLKYLCDVYTYGNVTHFADLLLLNRRYVGRVLYGEIQPSLPLIVRTLKALDVRADWLLFGTGKLNDVETVETSDG